MQKRGNPKASPCHEWYSVLWGSTQLSLLVSTRWEPGFLSRVVDQVGNLEFSRYVYGLSRGVKVNEFAELTTSECVSEFPEENPNIVEWSEALGNS